jgi:K+-sensing histidine kinase KdpD
MTVIPPKEKMHLALRTHFASPERVSDADLRYDILSATNNPVINALLSASGGLLAVLNEHRQILTVNNALLELLGIDNPHEVLGLRPGEAIKCVHADDMPSGCGTGKFCKTCGAAIAIVSTLVTDNVVERTCAITTNSAGRQRDIHLKVKAAPFTGGTEKFILLFLQDITVESRRAALERVFFHDINNILTCLSTMSEMFEEQDETGKKEFAHRIGQVTTRLSKEVDIQRALMKAESDDYTLLTQKIPLTNIVSELEKVAATHPAAKDKFFDINKPVPLSHITTDFSLLLRVLSNMLTNGFEASDEGDTVKLTVEERKRAFIFSIWKKYSRKGNALF